MNNKYEIIETDFKITFMGVKVFRIKAKTKIEKYGVNEGDLGGYIEGEKNLQVSGNAWVYGNAQVYGNAWVYGNARVYGNAQVYGNAWVYGNARVYGNAQVYGNAWVYGNAQVYGNAWVYGNARVYGNATKSPLHLIGTKYHITIADNQVVWGCREFTFAEVKSLEFKDCNTQWNENEFKLNKKIITEMIRYYRSEAK